MTNQPTNKLNLNFGIILGGIFSFFTAYSYAIDNSLYSSYWAFGGLLILPLIFGVIAILSAKKKSGGFITLKDGMKNFTATITLGLFISTMTGILVFNVVDTDFHKVVQQIQVDGLEKQKDRTLQGMYNRNTPESSIKNAEKGFDEAIEKIQTTNSFSIQNQLLVFIKSVGIYLIFGLILAMILKKQDPQSI